MTNIPMNIKNAGPNDPLVQLIKYLFSAGEASSQPPASLLAAIAGERPLLDELDLFSSLLTGEESQLKATTDPLMICQECLERLPDYVAAQLNGATVELLYPRVHAHLAACVECREDASLLVELERSEMAQTSAPTYLNFAEWMREQSAVARSNSFAATPLWRQVQLAAHSLVAEINIRLAEAQARFAELPNGLAPQLAPVSAFRSSIEETTEILELPSPDTNHLLKVRLGPVVSGTATLILEIGTLIPAAPLPNAKVALRDEDGYLLESVTSNLDGLAIFQNLDPEKYQIEVSVEEQLWRFVVNVQTSA